MNAYDLTAEEKGFLGGLKGNHRTIFSILSEILAEWMPHRSQVKGPIRNMVDLAMLDHEKEKARQMLLIYLSDSWFYDTDTRFMYPYTDIMVTLFLRFIQQDDVDFLAMHQELESIFEYLLACYRHMVMDALLYVKSLEFRDERHEQGKHYNYEDLGKEIENSFKDFDNKHPKIEIDTNDCAQLRFWNTYFFLLTKLSPATTQNILTYFDEKEKELMVKVAERFMLSDYRERFGTDLQKYVLHRMHEVGFNLENVHL